MAGGDGEMTYMPFFENCILTRERRAAAEARYAEYSSSGDRLLCCIDITDYPSAFVGKKTPHGAWLALVEELWDDICERQGNDYSFGRVKELGRDITLDLRSLALDFYRRNTLLAREQFVNACRLISKTARARPLKAEALAGSGYVTRGAPTDYWLTRNGQNEVKRVSSLSRVRPKTKRFRERMTDFFRKVFGL